MRTVGRLSAFWLMIVVPCVHAETVKVDVGNIQVEKGGQVIVLMFDERGFPVKHEKALAVMKKPVAGEAMSFLFKKPDVEHVAFKVLHDHDLNDKVTKNWAGVWPVEGLGFSNGREMGPFGPPKFDEARIPVVDIGQVVEIDIKYP